MYVCDNCKCSKLTEYSCIILHTKCYDFERILKLHFKSVLIIQQTCN